MNSEHPEYNRDTNPYPSFGKKYAGERGVISLTSWRARISTVSKTLFSLIQQCPGFHIVLVLSEEEFPKMMDELPDNLKLFVDNELIEVLWVYKNYKSFKKVLFTMDKYRTVPVISADDDCIYTCNYAQELYNVWKNNKNDIVSINKSNQNGYSYGPWGIATIHPPHNYELNERLICFLEFLKRMNISSDDMFYGLCQTSIKHNNIISLNKKIKDIGIYENFYDTSISKENVGYKFKRNSMFLYKTFKEMFINHITL